MLRIRELSCMFPWPTGTNVHNVSEHQHDDDPRRVMSSHLCRCSLCDPDYARARRIRIIDSTGVRIPCAQWRYAGPGGVDGL
eukprot:190564-Rhodomonas_salina.4